MNTFFVPSSRTPVTFLDPAGNPAFTRPWFLFFQQLFERVGGASGTGTQDLAESLTGDTDAQLAAAVYGLTGEVRSMPAPIAPVIETAIASEMSDVRAELAELRKLIEGIQQGTTL